MRIWIDAQLSPAIAAWINRTFEDIVAESVRSIGMRNALDHEIFEQARQKVEQYGPPPKIIWVTCGNTSNARMREILSKTLI